MPEKNPFNDAFKELADLIEGMTALARLNKATYNAHIQAGFSPDQSMDLTKHALTLMVDPFIQKALDNV